MAFPAAIGICEDDLKLDLTFLKAFAGPGVDLRMNPLHGGPLEGKAARIIRGQVEAMRGAGIPVRAVVVHHDVDRASLGHRVQEIERWYRRHRLGEMDLALVVCAPDPCLERWLCLLEGLERRVRKTSPSAGGDPWKLAWSRGKGIALDRVRQAATQARQRLRGQLDFDRFFSDWKKAGLEP
jgi:hypothetical protein